MPSKSNILLTGATGLIGGEIAALLGGMGHRIWAVVRAKNQIDAAHRIAARFTRSGYSVPSTIIPVCGDITQSDLGIRDTSILESIRKYCQVIVHAAGATDFKNDRRCYDVNVKGALEIVRESGRWTNNARLFFLSTSYVCSSPGGVEISEDMPTEGYANGYIKSKRAAESLFRNSRLEVVILRPSIVISKGLNDRRFARSILWFIPVATKLGMIPVNKNAQLDIVPVDYVSSCVVRLLEQGIGSGCYNVTGGSHRCVTMAAIMDIAYERIGVRVDFVPHRAWNAMKRKGRGSCRQLMRAVEYYVPFINSNAVYSPARIQSALGKDMPRCVPFTEYCASCLDLIEQDEAILESENP